MMDLYFKIIFLLPLISALLIFAFRSVLLKGSGIIGSIVSGILFLISIFLLFKDGGQEHVIRLFDWLSFGNLKIDIGVLVNQKSLGMLFLVTFIGFLVHIFSINYMKNDSGQARYFGSLSFFMFSMLGIVFSSNFVMMFIFWELVGLSSFVLIGHWYEKKSAFGAANKAFIVNKIGDVGYLIGIFLLWRLVGSFDFVEIRNADYSLYNSSILSLIVLLIFCGAMGKSAQFPLHVWLPDAMVGPTPVSALIHAATMVAAGVFMLVKISALILSAELAGDIIAILGCITAVLAGFVAIKQNDIKKILAYSTLSQLGYMVMVIGMGSGDVALFHLYTHAFFKALLFLCAGAIIYACHHEQDIWKMGGLRLQMMGVFIAFIFGSMALMGFPFTSGFFSKEYILAVAYEKGMLFFIFSVIVAILTSFYMMRLILVVFMGSHRSDIAFESGKKDLGLAMMAPLFLLSIFSIFSAYKIISNRIAPVYPTNIEVNKVVLVCSIGALFLGIILAFLLYRNKKTEPLGSLNFLAKGFYIDKFYNYIVAIFRDGIATLLIFLDKFLLEFLGLGLILGGSARRLSSLIRKSGTGNLHFNIFYISAGFVFILFIFFVVLK